MTKSRSKLSKLDFGRGFYATEDLTQAQKWAARSADGGEVLAFRVRASDLHGLRQLNLSGKPSSFRWFVRHNRLGGRMHRYDVVFGPMLGNPLPPRAAPRWFRGTAPRFFGSQTSFHTQEAIDLLYRGLLP